MDGMVTFLFELLYVHTYIYTYMLFNSAYTVILYLKPTIPNNVHVNVIIENELKIITKSKSNTTFYYICIATRGVINWSWLQINVVVFENAQNITMYIHTLNGCIYLMYTSNCIHCIFCYIIEQSHSPLLCIWWRSCDSCETTTSIRSQSQHIWSGNCLLAR
jgi:hypothetical protein